MHFIRHHFGTLLIICSLTGLFVPSVGDITPLIVILALAFIIFCSFFQINFDASLLLKDVRISFLFWLLRFILIPVILFFAFKGISVFLSGIILLSFVLPAAVSSPAFAVIYGGKPDLSLKVLLLSSFLSVITIPFLLSWLLGKTVHIDTAKMLLTLVYTIIIPFLIHLPFRKLKSFKHFIDRNNPLFTLIGLGSIFIIVTAYNKDAFFNHPHKAAYFATISLIIFSFMYVLGYFLMPLQHRDVRTTFSISSGANNIGLGVTITALFFKGDINGFFIVAQLIWIVMLIPLRRVFGKAR